MKKSFIFTIFILFIACACWGADLNVTWTYSGVASGFNLYADGKQICTVKDGTAKSMVCTTDLTYGNHNFTLTAVNAEGVEGAPSAPFPLAYHAPLAGIPAISDIQVK